MITISCCFAHSFKIMCITQPVIPLCVPPQPIQALCSGRGGEIDVMYIRCLNGRVPKAYKLWALAEDEVCEVHPSSRVRLLDDFREDTFHTHFFNSWWFQIPFLGRRSVNISVEFLDAARATQQVGNCVASWTENIFVNSWIPYPTMNPHTVSTITRRAYNVPVTPHALLLRANHERINWNMLSGDKLVIESWSLEFVKTCITRFVLSFVLPCPIIPMKAGLRYPTQIDKVLILSTIWVSFIGLFLASTYFLESLIVSMCSPHSLYTE